jgi:hypothetical protein
MDEAFERRDLRVEDGVGEDRMLEGLRVGVKAWVPAAADKPAGREWEGDDGITRTLEGNDPEPADAAQAMTAP